MKLVKEIRSKSGELHFQRWAVLQTRFGSVYLHYIPKGDQDKHCHDHPWDFLSIVLTGGYMELRDGEVSLRSPGSGAYMKASGTYHKILDVVKPAWTLVFSSAPKHDWGYWTEEGWVQNAVYRRLKREGHWNA